MHGPLFAGRDLMLRLVDRAPVEGERMVALGESMLDREQRGGVLMTVDVFRVRAVAEGVTASVLLGRTIAHEIGHLLLGSGEHARLGLMRALWSRDELRGLKPAHWGFSSREAAQMRHTLRGRRARLIRLTARPHPRTCLTWLPQRTPSHLAHPSHLSHLSHLSHRSWLYSVHGPPPTFLSGGSFGASRSRRRHGHRRAGSGVSSATKQARRYAARSCGQRPGARTFGAPLTLTTATDDRGRFVFVITPFG